MKELLDIATRRISGEEAVGAVFILGDGKTAPSASWGGGHYPKPPAKALRKVAKTTKRSKSHAPNRS
jgi:hypothetical protein